MSQLQLSLLVFTSRILLKSSALVSIMLSLKKKKVPLKNGFTRVSKKKNKKKKDLNKRGKSKEVGDMDAFLDKAENNWEKSSKIIDEILNEDQEGKKAKKPDEALSENQGEVQKHRKMTLKVECLSGDNEKQENQLSPWNPEGRRQYDREFLLILQSQPLSMKKPSNLPDIDVIKDKATLHKLKEMNNKTVEQVSRDKKYSLMAKSKETNNKIFSEVQYASRAGYTDPFEPATAVGHDPNLFSKVRVILNKLTPQTFSKLVPQVKQLNISTEGHLNGVVDLVYETAIAQPELSVTYAEMCKHLALIKVPSRVEGKFVNFRKLLVTKCRKQFEDSVADEQNREQRIRLIQECGTNEKRRKLQEDYEENEQKNKSRRLGNIRFLGELFNLGMLTKAIMHQCIKKLLNQGGEHSLECLCCLLTCIGKKLEKGEKTNVCLMKSYFTDLKKIFDNRQTVQFMLQNVIDLRANNWVPLHDDNSPKTTDQIHVETNGKALFFSQMAHMPSTCPQIPTQQIQVQARPKKTAHYEGLPILDSVTGRDVREDITNELSSQRAKDGSQSGHIEGEVNALVFRYIVTAIYESVITGSGDNTKLNISKLNESMHILEQYMDANRNFEVHAIFALQYLMNKLDHPKGILLQIFDHAYNADFLSEDAFKQWECCDDPDKQEGKNLAIRSVSSFFTWLKEEEDSESS